MTYLKGRIIIISIRNKKFIKILHEIYAIGNFIKMTVKNAKKISRII